MRALTVLPVAGLPEVVPGDDLAALIADAAELHDGDVVVVAQKVVSKAEGALVTVPAGEDRAAARTRLAREQAVRVLVVAPWTIVVETPQGLVCASAGIDASNVAPGQLALLPADPDASARRLREDLRARAGVEVAVIVADTFGRPWRVGQTDVAIGLSGLTAIRDERGRADRFGMRLEVTEVAVADEIAAAADLVRHKAEGVPVVVVRGLGWQPDEGASATDLQRPPATDLFPRGRGALADALAAPGPPAGAGDPGHDAVDASGPIEPGAAPSEDDWRRALAAARATGATVERLDATTAAVTADDRYALGAAAATLCAAFADLGWGCMVEHENQARVRVLVGRTVSLHSADRGFPRHPTQQARTAEAAP
jgi:coenzyme F420-0:L-glutamate ligase / coenzyme F420-1:gamma-L-glutamate ligase